MRRFLPVLFGVLVFLLFGVSKSYSSTDPGGGADVNANVNNPNIPTTSTPTPIFLSPTPTPTGILAPTPTTVPSGGQISPTPGPGGGNGQDIYLDISGFASPNASIVMTSGSVFIRSTVADSQGNFFISQIRVNQGFSEFCLEAIDIQRIGDSTTCFKIPPMTESTSKTNIFLPPTIGLSAKTITVKSSSFAFGYTMPGASVNVHVSDAINLAIFADKKGYYKVEVKNLPVGTYQLFAAAKYNGKPSEKPSKTLELKSLSGAGAAQQGVLDLLRQLFTSLLGFILRYGWLAIPILMLIIILISKRLRDWLHRAIVGEKKQVNLHHSYFIGY